MGEEGGHFVGKLDRFVICYIIITSNVPSVRPLIFISITCGPETFDIHDHESKAVLILRFRCMRQIKYTDGLVMNSYPTRTYICIDNMYLRRISLRFFSFCPHLLARSVKILVRESGPIEEVRRIEFKEYGSP